MVNFDPLLAIICVFLTLIVLSIVFGTLLCIMKRLKEREIQKEKEELHKKQDKEYANSWSIFDTVYRFSVFGNCIDILTDDDLCEFLTIDTAIDDAKYITLHIISESVYGISKIKRPINSKIFKINKESNISTTIDIRFIICNIYSYNKIVDNPKFDNCIFLVGDREIKTLNIIVKEDGKILYTLKFRHMDQYNKNSILIYSALKSDPLVTRYGKIQLLKIAGFSEDILLKYFCLMCDFDPDYKKPVYDYYY